MEETGLKEVRGGDEVGVDRDGDDHGDEDVDGEVDVDDSMKLFMAEGGRGMSSVAAAATADICSDRSDIFRNRSANSPVNSPMVIDGVWANAWCVISSS